jgi:hypothetical protein
LQRVFCRGSTTQEICENRAINEVLEEALPGVGCPLEFDVSEDLTVEEVVSTDG